MKNIRLLLIALLVVSMGSALEAFKIGEGSGRGHSSTRLLDSETPIAEESRSIEASTASTAASTAPRVLPPSLFFKPNAKPSWIRRLLYDAGQLVDKYIVPIVWEKFVCTKSALDNRWLTPEQLKSVVFLLAERYHPLILDLNRRNKQSQIDFMRKVFPEETQSQDGLLYKFLYGYVQDLKIEWLGLDEQIRNQFIESLDVVIRAGTIGSTVRDQVLRSAAPIYKAVLEKYKEENKFSYSYAQDLKVEWLDLDEQIRNQFIKSLDVVIRAGTTGATVRDQVLSSAALIYKTVLEKYKEENKGMEFVYKKQ